MRGPPPPPALGAPPRLGRTGGTKVEAGFSPPLGIDRFEMLELKFIGAPADGIGNCKPPAAGWFSLLPPGGILKFSLKVGGAGFGASFTSLDSFFSSS